MSDLLHIGWNPSLDVPAALERMPTAGRSRLYAPVSMIDSAPRVARLPSLVPLLEDRRVPP